MNKTIAGKAIYSLISPGIDHEIISDIKEKFLQIASIRDVEVYVFDRVI